jgi:hypothetical protein
VTPCLAFFARSLRFLSLSLSLSLSPSLSLCLSLSRAHAHTRSLSRARSLSTEKERVEICKIEAESMKQGNGQLQKFLRCVNLKISSSRCLCAGDNTHQRERMALVCLERSKLSKGKTYSYTHCKHMHAHIYSQCRHVHAQAHAQCAIDIVRHNIPPFQCVTQRT